MKRYLLFQVIFSVSLFTVYGQDFSTYIKNNAIRIEKPDSLDSGMYESFSGYKLIMVGEMHGTNKPAKFVIGLARLMTHKGDSVQVGLEIPSEKMNQFLEKRSDSSIYSSGFFTETSNDGRASAAWAEVISRLNRNSGVKIFFFDANNGDCKKSDDRDSMMYLKIKRKIKEHPQWKTLTLSGNIASGYQCGIRLFPVG